MPFAEVYPFHLLAAFVSASFLLAVVPGPGVIFVLTKVLSEGRLAGLISSMGVALGNLSNAVGSTLGLAVLFAVSPSAFLVVKYAGALYLLYLGVLALRLKESRNDAVPVLPQTRGRVFRDGFVVALLNPKTALFLALLTCEWV